MTKILEKNRNKALKSLFTKQAFFHYYLYQGVETLYHKRKSVPDSIAVFMREI